VSTGHRAVPVVVDVVGARHRRPRSSQLSRHVFDPHIVVFSVFFDDKQLDVAAEALRAKIDRKLAISLQRGQFEPKFQVELSSPTISFARIVRPMNALQLFC